MSSQRFDEYQDLGDSDDLSLADAEQRDFEEEGESAAVTRDSKVTLREITADSVEDVLRLEVAPEQKHLVAANDRSIAQAHFNSHAWFRAIYADDTPVGFVMLYDDPESATYFLWRLMIDARYQRLGFGSQALDLIKKHVRNRPGADTLGTSVVPGEHSPAEFYRRLGFAETGEVDDGEVVMSCSLWPS